MVKITEDTQVKSLCLPSWFHQDIPDIHKIRSMQALFRGRSLETVCERAHCPNMGQCWQRGVATFMILGDVCSRSCRFCAVSSGQPSVVNDREPTDVAEMVADLGLQYVVITSVTRDDLGDGGADQFIKTVRALRKKVAGIRIELLIPDFLGRKDLIEAVAAAAPDVLAHNVEMVERLFPAVRPQAAYRRSLDVLRIARAADDGLLVKSGVMVGLGETDGEVDHVMSDLKEAGCDMLTIGQYLAPSQQGRHIPVDRFVDPAVFEQYRRKARALGFRHVFSGPLVRSSYIAEAGYLACQQT